MPGMVKNYKSGSYSLSQNDKKFKIQLPRNGFPFSELIEAHMQNIRSKGWVLKVALSSNFLYSKFIR